MKGLLSATVLVLAFAVLTSTQTPGTAPWTTYNGQLTGNRFSSLSVINTGNVATLRPVNSFTIPSNTSLETTPIVLGYTMWVTGTNSVTAYNLTNGQPVWSFSRPPTRGVTQDAASGTNRGVAIGPNAVFYATDNAHLIALNAGTGAVQWETVMADYTQNYGATSAPLYLPGPNLVVSGVSGGDSGVRGFLAAYDANSGNPIWQFYTTPSGPSDPLAATWGDGSVLPHGCGATWMTGSYDTSTNVLYWGVGNPCPDYNGDNRQGANLYTSSVIALNASTGALQWYFQFTPHNVWDFDGAATPILVNANWQGQPRNLLMHANRNGYFYVLDRGTGQFLSASPFVNNLTWATGIDTSGNPIVNSAAIPTTSGVVACPSTQGAHNWESMAYSPVTSLFYVQAREACGVYAKRSPTVGWQAGMAYPGGITSSSASVTSQKHLRAINPSTGAIVWDYPEQGYASSMGGVLATAGGLVFFGDDSGAISAANASTGSLLWSYNLPGKGITSSPMTYEANKSQFIAIAAPNRVLVFGLPQASSVTPNVGCGVNTGSIGATYSSALTASGGTPPYTFSTTGGSLPPGLSLNASTGAITGTPATGGLFSYTATVSDSTGTSSGTASTGCGVAVTPLPLVVSCPQSSASSRYSYLSNMAGAGGVAPYQYSIGGGTLPAGLSMNNLGVISGALSTPGTFSFTATVTDATGTSTGASCSIAVGN